jgi:hypothetical protein
MTHASIIPIAALAWFAVSAPTAAEPSPDIAATPAAVTIQAEAKIIEGTPAEASLRQTRLATDRSDLRRSTAGGKVNFLGCGDHDSQGS